MNPQAMQASLWPGEYHEARSMGGFGERMQREREMRSISLEEIAESTKIGCRMLRALEEEDFDKLPGGIFNKGFVRAYAKFLGIDEEQAVTDFQAAFIERQQRQSTNGSNGLHAENLSHTEVLRSLEASSYSETMSQPDQAAGFMRAGVILVIVLGLGGMAWKFWGNKTALPDPAAAKPAVTTQQPARVAAPAVKTPEAPNSTSEVTNPPASAASTPAKEVTHPATEPEATPSAEAGKFRLRIHARETSWVHITADGKVLMAAELSANATRSFQAAKDMVVVLGNAPGVELSYNGNLLAQFPADQKTKKLTFTAEGLQQ